MFFFWCVLGTHEVQVSIVAFDHFWWAKVGLYDKKNQEALRFWQNVDLIECQSERMLFGSG